MEIQKILSTLFREKKLDKLINRHNNPDDLKQDVFVALLSKPQELIADLNERGMLFYYTASLIKYISIKNKKRLPLCELQDVAEHHYEEIEYPIDHLPTINDFPYFLELAKTVAKYGSVYRAAKEIGIPVSSVRRDMLFIKSYLKNKSC